MTLSDSQAGGNSHTSAVPTLGKYKIVRVIARSNDIVYEAIDPVMNRRVAVKELALSGNLSGQQRRERIERFYREAKAAGNLSHPNIVTVHDVGHDNDRHYIAMEYLEGPSLRDILRMRTTLPIREALTVTLQLTDALGYAHAQGIVHRDVKPDNIHLILPNDAVKLTDFGIARILSDPAITSTGQVFGTPSYMSPEQIMSKKVDHRTDIFSLGVVLFEMVVGKKPFQGDSVITITYHIMNSTPPIPNNLPTGVYNIINRALAKDPELRYQNMASMAADLHSELAFSDSPYHKTIPPGVLSFDDITSDQTAMVDQANLSNHSAQPVTSLPQAGYAPSTGMVDGAAGAPSIAATPPPAYLPTPTDPNRSAMTLLASIVGVVVLILVMVFAVAKAYEANKQSEEIREAQGYYDKAQIERSAGDEASATADYHKAFETAPPETTISKFAEQALTQTAPAASAATLPNPLSSPVPDTPPPDPTTTTTPDATTQPSTTSPPVSSDTGSTAADSDLMSANNYANEGDQTDQIAELVAAQSADPMGSSGKQAGSELAQIYSQKADAALVANDKKTALNDWHLVIQYAPQDPLAQAATQKISLYGYGGSSDNSSTDNGAPTAPANAPTSP